MYRSRNSAVQSARSTSRLASARTLTDCRQSVPGHADATNVARDTATSRVLNGVSSSLRSE